MHDWAATTNGCRSTQAAPQTKASSVVRPENPGCPHGKKNEGSVRSVHVEQEGDVAQQLSIVHGGVPAAPHFPNRNAILQLAGDQLVGQLAADVHDNVPCDAPGSQERRHSYVYPSDQDSVRSSPVVVGATPHAGGSLHHPGGTPTSGPANFLYSVENGEPLGRREGAMPDGHHPNQPVRGRNMFSNHEGDVYEAVPPRPPRTLGAQVSNQGVACSDVYVQPLQTDHERIDHGSKQNDAQHSQGPKRFEQMHKEGSGGPPDKACGDGPPPVGRSGQATETRSHPAIDPRHVGEVHDRQGHNGNSNGIGPGDVPAVAPPKVQKKQKSQVPHPPPHVQVSKASKASTPAEIRDIPFHVRNVRRIDTGRVRTLSRGLSRENRLITLLRYNDDGSIYTPMLDKDIDNTPATNLSDADIAAYEAAHQTRIVPRSFVKATVIAFPVTEEKIKQDTTKFLNGSHLPPVSGVTKRRRGIAWPKWNNDVLAFESEMELLALKEQLGQVHEGDSATCADLTMSFSQLETSEAVQAFHCFRDKHGIWRCFTVMVMGGRPSSETMETVTWVLATARQSPNVLREVRVKTHVDNIRYLHPNPFLVNDAMRQFLSNCYYVGADVNADALIAPHSFGTSFGVVHDYHAGLAALSEKHLRKAVQANTDMHSQTLTVRRVCEILGLLFYASTVLRINLASFYFPLKWYRRIAHDFEKGSRNSRPFGLDTIVRPWPSILPNFTRWFRDILKNTPVSHETTEPTVTLFCDASKTGCGAVLIDGVCPSYRQYGEALSAGEYAEIWNEADAQKSISLLETRAAAKAIRHFSSFLLGKSVKVYIDNTSLLGALGKTYSKSFALNGELLELINEMEASGAKLTCEYVPSALNRADRNSRLGQRGPGL